ncbi:MAG: crossover junction endodeoxyribonuclease RuvC, crossover junction endodeoxyribonuclease RuvC [Candidatus Parcubacteria bacterium]|jgi:crossover junction endodeoxyribonuclease RuvC
MIILAIDPGFERLGVAILSKEGSTQTLLYSTCVQTDKRLEFSERLLALGLAVETVIAQYMPEALAIEELFFTTNQKTVMKVAEVRGMLIYTARKLGLGIYEYTPLQIKTAITGYGRADKNQIQLMVHRLIEVPSGAKLDDELDAIACGLTHFAYDTTRRLSTL